MRCLAPRLENVTATWALPKRSPTVPVTRRSPRSMSTSTLWARPVAQALGRLHERLGLAADVLEHRPPQQARRQQASQLLGRHRLHGVGAGQHVADEPVADVPLLEGVERDGDGVLDLVGV